MEESTGKFDFIGNEIFVGSNAVYLWHCKTRPEYKNAIVIGYGEKTIKIKYNSYNEVWQESFVYRDKLIVIDKLQIK